MEQLNEKDTPTAKQLAAELKRIKYKKDYRKTLLSTFTSVVVAAAIAIVVSTLLLPVLRVTGTSMAPTLMNDDLVICRKRSDFQNGDVVAFYLNNKVLLKRVIGRTGDVIDIKEDGQVFVNGKKLDEPYVSQDSLGECDIDFPYTVPENRIFVMGDNRPTSIDSRSTAVGCIADEFIIGKVVLRIWPIYMFGEI